MNELTESKRISRYVPSSSLDKSNALLHTRLYGSSCAEFMGPPSNDIDI